MIRGEVHDENAWSLGGVAGHAGIFSTARDLAVLGRPCSTVVATVTSAFSTTTQCER